ncbi:MAG TPA: Crp/Fnr family transcriptional regulator [Chitinophagaceae bacterium]|jgi:CRP/FNR family transcriptional regulator|nr:Crp/Fnr family transcriptional regulator [Chitinophagaceae bacterium]
MISTDIIHNTFPGFEAGLVEEISNHATLRDFRDGEVLVKTGQYFRSVIMVVSGLVKIFREDEEGNEYFMYYLQPGQACALSMICATRQQTSQLKMAASADTEVITVPLEYMDKWMLKYKSWYYFVLDNYRSRFQELLLTIDHIAFRNMDERLLFYFKRQQETLKTNILTVNHTEIAQELNSSREVISRLMKKLAEKGMIENLKNQQVKIVRLDIN